MQSTWERDSERDVRQVTQITHAHDGLNLCCVLVLLVSAFINNIIIIIIIIIIIY